MSQNDEQPPGFTCEAHPDELCGCGLRPGDLELRGGCLCAVDHLGRLYVRAPRRADVALAQRLVAAVRGSAGGPAELPPDITAVREQ